MPQLLVELQRASASRGPADSAALLDSFAVAFGRALDEATMTFGDHGAGLRWLQK
jgi:hypothetical protein